MFFQIPLIPEMIPLIILPSIVIGIVAEWFSILELQWRGYEKQQLRNQHQESRGTSYDPSYEDTFEYRTQNQGYQDQYSYQYQSQNQQQQQQQQHQHQQSQQSQRESEYQYHQQQQQRQQHQYQDQQQQQKKPKVDFYERLGISKQATAREIKQAYLKKVMQYHPDRNPGNAEVLYSYYHHQ